MTPACDAAPSGRGDVLVEAESRAARYNPLYYAIVGLPTLVAPGKTTVYVMRLVNAALVAGLLMLAAIALREAEVTRWGFVALGYATTPMTLFLTGGVNPNGVEIAGGLALWATLLAWLGRPDPALDRGRVIRAAVAGVALVMPRALGPLFGAFVVLGSLLVVPHGGFRRAARATRWAALVVALAAAASLAWSIGVGTVATPAEEYPEFRNIRRYIFSMVVSLDEFQREMVGVLGWLDTPLQPNLYVLWFAVSGFLVLAALAVGTTRDRVVLLGLLALSSLVPLVVQWPTAPELGIVWQGRYLLPLMVGLPIVAGWVLGTHGAWNGVMRGGWAAGVPLVTLAVVQVAAFWWALHRNVIGIDEGWIGFEPLWQPPGGWIQLTLAYALAVSLWTVTLARLAEPRVVRLVEEAPPVSVEAAA